MHKYFSRCLYIIILGTYIYGCSLPQIIMIEDPLTPAEHLNLGVAYEKEGELDAAIMEYEKASKDLPLAFVYMGNIYFEKKDYKRAEGYYTNALEGDDRNADAYNNLAWIYYIQNKNLDIAEEYALRAIDINPEKRHYYEDTLVKIRESKRIMENIIIKN